jgi:uncharacterized protein (DUF1778 family)
VSSRSRDQINVRITPALRARLKRLAAERNTSISGAIKSAVLQATKQGGVPDEQEILELLGEAAQDRQRGGHEGAPGLPPRAQEHRRG